jgi:hypothetical protein
VGVVASRRRPFNVQAQSLQTKYTKAPYYHKQIVIKETSKQSQMSKLILPHDLEIPENRNDLPHTHKISDDLNALPNRETK